MALKNRLMVFKIIDQALKAEQQTPLQTQQRGSVYKFLMAYQQTLWADQQGLSETAPPPEEARYALARALQLVQTLDAPAQDLVSTLLFSVINRHQTFFDLRQNVRHIVCSPSWQEPKDADQNAFNPHQGNFDFEKYLLSQRRLYPLPEPDYQAILQADQWQRLDPLLSDPAPFKPINQFDWELPRIRWSLDNPSLRPKALQIPSPLVVFQQYYQLSAKANAPGQFNLTDDYPDPFMLDAFIGDLEDFANAVSPEYESMLENAESTTPTEDEVKNNLYDLDQVVDDYYNTFDDLVTQAQSFDEQAHVRGTYEHSWFFNMEFPGWFAYSAFGGHRDVTALSGSVGYDITDLPTSDFVENNPVDSVFLAQDVSASLEAAYTDLWVDNDFAKPVGLEFLFFKKHPFGFDLYSSDVAEKKVTYSFDYTAQLHDVTETSLDFSHQYEIRKTVDFLRYKDWDAHLFSDHHLEPWLDLRFDVFLNNKYAGWDLDYTQIDGYSFQTIPWAEEIPETAYDIPKYVKYDNDMTLSPYATYRFYPQNKAMQLQLLLSGHYHIGYDAMQIYGVSAYQWIGMPFSNQWVLPDLNVYGELMHSWSPGQPLANQALYRGRVGAVFSKDGMQTRLDLTRRFYEEYQVENEPLYKDIKVMELTHLHQLNTVAGVGVAFLLPEATLALEIASPHGVLNFYHTVDGNFRISEIDFGMLDFLSVSHAKHRPYFDLIGSYQYRYDEITILGQKILVPPENAVERIEEQGTLMFGFRTSYR